jgi:hypothetical protein
MYTFAIVALLALGTVKVIDFLVDSVPQLRPMKSFLTIVLAVGTVLALDLSVFAEWDVAIDNETLGTWVTGFMVAGLTVPWRALFAYLTHDRADRDETLGEHRSPLSKVA